MLIGLRGDLPAPTASLCEFEAAHSHNAALQFCERAASFVMDQKEGLEVYADATLPLPVTIRSVASASRG